MKIFAASETYLRRVDKIKQIEKSKNKCLWSPAKALGDPTDFGLAHGTLDPIAAPLLHYHHLTSGATQGLVPFQHFLRGEQQLCATTEV